MKRGLDLAVFIQVTSRGFTALTWHYLRAGPHHSCIQKRAWPASGSDPHCSAGCPWSAPARPGPPHTTRGFTFLPLCYSSCSSSHLESLLSCLSFNLPHTPTSQSKRTLLWSGGGNSSRCPGRICVQSPGLCWGQSGGRSGHCTVGLTLACGSTRLPLNQFRGF